METGRQVLREIRRSLIRSVVDAFECAPIAKKGLTAAETYQDIS